MLANQARVDLLPGAIGPSDYLSPDPSLLHQQRIKISLGTFLLLLIAGLLFTWLRPSIYQSTAILHAQYQLSDSAQMSTPTFEQLIVHQQRLISPRVLLQLSSALDDSGIKLEAEHLSELLSADILPDSRLLSLKSNGTDAQKVYQTLKAWIELYLADFKAQQGNNADDETPALGSQIQDLKSQVAEQRNKLKLFRKEHKIISLERNESRILNKMKALGKAVDEATAEKAAAESDLNAIKKAMRDGKNVIRPQDQASIDNMESRSIDLSDKLQDYSEQYTAEYMALDPSIVAVQRKLHTLQEKIELRKTASQQTYLNEAEQNLASTIEKKAALNREVGKLEQQAQAFSTRYQEFSGLSLELENLELDLQSLKSELVQQQVRRPHQEKLLLLEPPYLAQQPISPLYWRDTLISIAIALAVAALFFTVHLFLYRRKNNPVGLYPVFTQLQQQQNHPEAINVDNRPLLATPVPQELSSTQVQQLIDSANDTTTLLILLLLSGVSPDEIIEMSWQQLDLSNSRIQLLAPSPRDIACPQALLDIASRLRGSIALDELLFSRNNEAVSTDDLEAMLECAVYDSNLAASAQITMDAIRHTYISYLVRQGLKFSLLNELVNYIQPERLKHYQSLSLPGEKKTLEEVNTLYPITSNCDEDDKQESPE